jgi:hypothetical protein
MEGVDELLIRRSLNNSLLFLAMWQQNRVQPKVKKQINDMQHQRNVSARFHYCKQSLLLMHKLLHKSPNTRLIVVSRPQGAAQGKE